jgi:hypothetical protein
MQQRATTSSQPVEQAEDTTTTTTTLSQPIDLTEAQLLQVVGGLGPNGGWAAATSTAGPNGGW